MGVSIKAVYTVGWTAIAIAVLAPMGCAFGIMAYSSVDKWPMYLSLPCVFMVMIGGLIGMFYLVAMRWVWWAYMNVTDVHELDNMRLLTGFGAYPPTVLQKRYPDRYEAIMQRYDTYVFADDMAVGYETYVVQKQPWQSGRVLFGCALTALIFYVSSLNGMEINDAVAFLLVVGCIAAVVTGMKIYSLIDREPQMIFNNEGVQLHGTFVPWGDMDSYGFVIQVRSEPAYLVIEANGRRYEVATRDLAGGALHLNHLVHVYSRRHRRDHPALYSKE